jgi:hypothetical protein
MVDRAWMYHGVGGEPLLYFKHVTQFVKDAKTNNLRMNKKEIWCPCKNCENNVMWTTSKMICEHLLQNSFIDNYSIWAKHGEMGENVQGNDTKQEREETGSDDSTHVLYDSHGGEGIDMEELLHNIEHGDFLQNRKRGFDNLETMEKASKELLYEESKGCDKECTVLHTLLDLLTLNARNRWSDTSFNQLLENFIPKLYSLPTRTYHAKKLLSPITMGIEKIHACPTCNSSRNKMNHHNTDDGSVDNRKKRARKQKMLLTRRGRSGQ